MKLKSLHIINFGTLHDFDYTFDEGLNVILHDNGWGKTTMAAFLKAMLYGFDSKRTRDITENERRRYYPWQGGEYGGSLDFEADNVNYRIHRTFGLTPRNDMTKIINLDTRTTARIDSYRIGETLFNLDASAFQRSIFITQNGLGIDTAASSIHTRLNALVSQANDVGKYDDAVNALNQEIKVYEKTGGRGRIGDISRLIEDKEQSRKQLETAIKQQDEARNRIIEIDYALIYLNHSLEEKKKQLEEVTGELKRKEAAAKLLEEIDTTIHNAEALMDAVSADFGGHVPQAADIETAKTQKRKAEEFTAEIKAQEEEIAALQQEMEQLIALYRGKLPSLTDIENIHKANSELQGVRSTDEEAEEPNPPKEYLQVVQALQNDSEYISQLESVIQMRDPILADMRKVESLKTGIDREEAEWKELKAGYAAAQERTAQMQKQLDAAEKYSPEQIDPIIRELEQQAKEEREIAQNLAAETKLIETEQINWQKTQERYHALQAEYTTACIAMEAQKHYSPEHAEPYIEKLAGLQTKEQALTVRQKTLDSNKLSAEQEAMIRKYPDPVGCAAQGRKMLQVLSVISANETEIQKRRTVLEGERSKAESLQDSYEQYASLPQEELIEVSEPAKPAVSIMIGLGIALVVAGLVLAFTVSMPMAVLAAAGAVLTVFGFVSSSRYQTQLKQYEDYTIKAAEQAETEKKKEALSKQLMESQAVMDDLTRGINDLEAQTQKDKAKVAEWVSGKQAGSQPADQAIPRIIWEAEQAAVLAQQSRRNQADQEELNRETETMKQQFSRITDAYEETGGLSISDALGLLRNRESEYRITNEQAANANKNLERFFAETKTTEEQLSLDTSPASAAASQRISELKEQEIQLEQRRMQYDSAYPEIESMSYENALETLRAAKSEYNVRKAQLETAKEQEEQFVNDTAFTREQLQSEVSPRLEGLVNERDAASAKLNDSISKGNQIVSMIGLSLTEGTEGTEGNVSLALRSADEILRIYKEQENRNREAQIRRQKRQEQILALENKVNALLSELNDRYEEKELAERLNLVRNDVQTADSLKHKIEEGKRKIIAAEENRSNAEAKVQQFCDTYIRFEPQSDNVLNEAEERLGKRKTLEETIRQANVQKQNLEEQNMGTGLAETREAEESLRFDIQVDEKRRDALRDEYTQKTDLIRQADQAAAVYPDLMTEIHQLYEQKQNAQNRVGMLKHTVELITKAKENLAGRYLSKVEQLFNNYMHLWLENETVRGILDIDFNVTIEEDDNVHAAEGYSTGYCDLIDFCMRLALVDTLFEKEQPFLVLDDPFVNLDEDHLEKALELIRIMAANKQIIYFLCHPIRAVETEIDESARQEYVKLAEETRKMLETRKSAPDTQKKQEMISPRDKYRVDEKIECVIEPAKPAKPITNNIFSLDFRLNTDNPKDCTYELFFIDEKGHVLNERQIIEVNSGALSNERIRFSLNTRDDSGDTYELMIREPMQDDYEVAARIPYPAKLTFTGTAAFDF